MVDQIDYIEKYFGQIPVIKLNIKDQQAIPYMQQYGVKVTPTTVVVSGNQLANRLERPCSAHEILGTFGITLPQ